MMSAQQMLERMLARIPNNYPKHEGSFFHDVLASVANDLSIVDDEIEVGKSKISIDKLTGNELTERVRERSGLERKQATYATGQVTVTGTGTINIGDAFETQSGIRFIATETKVITNSGIVNVRAVTAGSSGNVVSNSIILFPVTLSGFIAVSNNSPTKDGFDAESDADLLERYYDKVRSPATSNNVSHFKSWANEVSGVGDARIFPTWNGVNTVKVVIINADKQPASQAIVNNVKAYIDPSNGLGEGQASAGSVVTVESAKGVKINVTVDITLANGYDETVVQATIVNNLINLLSEIAFKESIVSYARVGSAILSTNGVNDYDNLKINNSASGVTIDIDEVAIVGTVTVNVT